MKLKYNKKEDIPSGLESYYKEKDGAWIRDDSKIEGIKSMSEFEEIKEKVTTLEKANKDLEKKYKPFEGLDAKEVTENLKAFESLKVKSGDSNKDIDEKVAKLLEIEKADWERKENSYKEQIGTLTETNGKFLSEKKEALLEKKIQKLITDPETNSFRVHAAAVEDITRWAKDTHEYNEEKNDWFTKNDSKLPLNESFESKAPKSTWMLGSTGSGDGGGKLPGGSKKEGLTGLDNMKEKWKE